MCDVMYHRVILIFILFAHFLCSSKLKVSAIRHKNRYRVNRYYAKSSVNAFLALNNNDKNTKNTMSNYLYAEQPQHSQLATSKDSVTISCPDMCTCRNYKHEGLTVNCTLSSKSELSTIQQLIEKIPNTTRNIHISHSHLSHLPANSLNNLQILRELYLTYNSLSDYNSWNRALRPDLAAELSHLSLSNNILPNIKPRSFKHFIKLHSLDLSANKISIIYPESFLGSESLLILDLRNNSLKALSKSCFEHLNTIQQLFLEFNQIESVEYGTFEELSDLQTLYLIGNRLETISAGMFIGAVSLQHLYLSENLIDVIESNAINKMTMLQELWLDGNRLSSLDPRLEKSFQKLRYGSLNLENNPFSCDCSLVWLANWLRQHTNENNLNATTEVLAAYPQCFTPPIHHAKLIHTIPLQDFHCGNSLWKPHRCITNRKLDDDCSILKSSICDTKMKNNTFVNPKNNSYNLQTLTDDGTLNRSCLCNSSVSDCYVCPVGWYGNHSSRIEEVTCKQCRVLTGSEFGSQRASDCKCLPGFYTDPQHSLSTCQECPINFYKSMLGPQSCTPCSKGAVTKIPGATICECLPGFQLHQITEFTSTCEPCPNGTYKAHSGRHRCRSCPDYSSSSSGSTSIKQCFCLYGGVELGSLTSPHRSCRPPSEKFIQASHQSPHSAKVQDYQTNKMEVLSIILLTIALFTVISLLAMVGAQKILRQKNKEQERISEAKKAQIVQICIPQPVEDTWIKTNISTWEIPRENLKLCQVLGQGAFGQVYEAIMDKDGVPTKVAVKCCRESTSALEEQEALWSELKLLIYVGKHSNIVNLIGTCFQNNSLMLILEYAAIGDLLTLLRTKAGIRRLDTAASSSSSTPVPDPVPITDTTPESVVNSPGCQLRRLNPRLNPLQTDMIPNILYSYSNSETNTQLAALQLTNPNSPTATTVSNETMETIALSSTDEMSKTIDERLLLSLAWQITKGMEHLEQLKCIHRDLAARNVLISEGHVAKISDFGLAREAYESGYYFRQSKGRLPFKWMAPEALLQGQCTNKSDVWSYGIVLWEMMTLGATPYPGVPLNSLMDFLLSGYRMPKPDACREDIFDVMQACWRETPSERPTFHDLRFQMDCIMQTASNQHYISIEEGENEEIA